MPERLGHNDLVQGPHDQEDSALINEADSFSQRPEAGCSVAFANAFAPFTLCLLFGAGMQVRGGETKILMMTAV